jgi:hypothetical protein
MSLESFNMMMFNLEDFDGVRLEAEDLIYQGKADIVFLD